LCTSLNTGRPEQTDKATDTLAGYLRLSLKNEEAAGPVLAAGIVALYVFVAMIMWPMGPSPLDPPYLGLDRRRRPDFNLIVDVRRR
jgi:hypothetical protein